MTTLDYHRLRSEEIRSWDLGKIESQVGPSFCSAISGLLPSVEDRFAGDLMNLERGPLFERIASLCRRYLQATGPERIYVRSRVNHAISGKFESFGLRAAVAGAREEFTELVRLGLVSFAIADLAGSDARDTLMSMPVLVECAKRVPEGARALFEEAAGYSGPAMAALFVDFVNRHPDLQALACMGWYAVETPAGIGFSRKPPAK